MGKVKATNEDEEEKRRRGGGSSTKQNRRNNAMVIFKKDKGGSHGVGGKQLQKEENASEKFSLEASLKQDGVGVSLSSEDRKKTEKKEETERNPSLQSPPATDSETGCAPRRPALPLFYTHDRFSLVQFGLDPTHPAQTRPGCRRRSRQSSSGGTASVSRTTRSGT